MRWALLAVGLICLTQGAAASPDEFARDLAGPWGQVGANWQSLTGALSKNSCPRDGVKRKETIGLFGDGGKMWIEPALGGSLNVYDGGPLPKLYLFMQMTGVNGAVYREGGAERRIVRIAPDRITHERLSSVTGAAVTNLARCAVKK